MQCSKRCSIIIIIRILEWPKYYKYREDHYREGGGEFQICYDSCDGTILSSDVVKIQLENVAIANALQLEAARRHAVAIRFKAGRTCKIK